MWCFCGVLSAVSPGPAGRAIHQQHDCDNTNIATTQLSPSHHAPRVSYFVVCVLGDQRTSTYNRHLADSWVSNFDTGQLATESPDQARANWRLKVQTKAKEKHATGVTKTSQAKGNWRLKVQTKPKIYISPGGRFVENPGDHSLQTK